MTPGFKPLYDACVATVAALVELDPPADSPEGRLLGGLAAAVEEYEKVEWPMTLRHEFGGSGSCACKGHPFHCFNHPNNCGCTAADRGAEL